MESNIISEAREKILDSPVTKYIDEETIENAISKIYVCSSTKELYDKYYEVNGFRNDGYLGGFNNNGISYILDDGDVHNVIHEIMHTLSSEFDKDGHRIVSGICGDKGKNDFGISVNEGLTDYLASKISGKNSDVYKNQKILFEGIDGKISDFFDDKDVLFDIYLNNDFNKLQYFIDICGGRGTCDEIYNQYDFMQKEKIQEYVNKINKGANKIINYKRFREKHPFLGKVVGKFSKYGQIEGSIATLPAASVVKSSKKEIFNELKQSVYEPGSNEINYGIDESIEGRKMPETDDIEV